MAVNTVGLLLCFTHLLEPHDVRPFRYHLSSDERQIKGPPESPLQALESNGDPAHIVLLLIIGIDKNHIFYKNLIKINFLYGKK
jgi:hypothetical protein